MSLKFFLTHFSFYLGACCIKDILDLSSLSVVVDTSKLLLYSSVCSSLQQ